MKRAAFYVRVSTDKQAEEKTSKTQIYELEEVIKTDGNQLMPDCRYEDNGWSGAILERPALDALRQDAKAEKFDILYVYDRGRLARKFVYQEIVIEELGNTGIEFKSLHDINGSSPEQQLMGNVMGVFHEYERIKIAERFRLAKLQKVRSNKLLGYNPPYGYDYIPVKGTGSAKVNGRFVVNKEEAKAVQLIFEWVGIENIPLREVIRRLYDMGIKPRKEKRDMWTKGPVARLLRNKTYIGEHSYNKSESCIPKNPSINHEKYRHRHTIKTSRKQRPVDEWLTVSVDPIIKADLFDKAQAQMALNIKFSQRSKKNQYLFGSLVWCKCGSKRVGEGVNGKTYYRCTERLHTFPLPRICMEGGVNVAVMDAVAWEKIASLLTSPKLIEQQIKRFTNVQTVKAKSENPSADIDRSLKGLTEEERRYAKMYGQSLMSEQIYQEQMQSIIKRRDALKIAQAQPENNKLEAFKSLDPAIMAEAFTKFVKGLDYKDKLFTVRKIVDKIIATKEEITICGFLPILEVSGTTKVGLRASDRHRRPAKCRQIYPIQCLDGRWGAGG
jgi:site-specific DNA recombinase